MSESKKWDPPGWPWELELLAVLFVIAAILIPFYFDTQTPAKPEELTLIELARKANAPTHVARWEDQVDFFWAAGIVGLYLVHLAMAGATSSHISTPITHLIAPLIFALITYYRLHDIGLGVADRGQVRAGWGWEMVLWSCGVLVITFLVARIRMARHMLGFRGVNWAMTTPTRWDASYFKLMLEFTPIIYPPRVYRLSEEGILVEGWLYLMPIRFRSIQSVDPVADSQILVKGNFLASSSRSLVRIQLADSPEPIFLSPSDRDSFLQYAHRYVLHGISPTTTTRAATRPGTRPGAKPGP